MENIYASGKDAAWLAQQIKNELGSTVSFNTYGIDNEVLRGIYHTGNKVTFKNSSGRMCTFPGDITFYIKYKKDVFLRIQIELGLYKEEDVQVAMVGLVESLAKIKQKEEIGYPIALYEAGESLTCEYAFQKKEEVIDALKKNELFDDGEVEHLVFVSNCQNCMKGSYAKEIETGKETLYCTDGGCDTEVDEKDACELHEYEEGDKPLMKVYCEEVCRRHKRDY